MTDRPILFSAPMVRALLNGSKTQTRRAIKAPGIEVVHAFCLVGSEAATGRAVYEMKDRDGRHVYLPKGRHFTDPHWRPSAAVGDRLWAREAWRVSENHDKRRPVDLPVRACTVMFEAGGSVANQGDGTWGLDEEWPIVGVMPRWAGRLRASMHLPRWASRLTLIVRGVRVQRLQDISRGDCMEEGCPFANMAAGPNPLDWYADLWNSINGPKSWDANPWVAAYTFDVIRANIDAIGAEK